MTPRVVPVGGNYEYMLYNILHQIMRLRSLTTIHVPSNKVPDNLHRAISNDISQAFKLMSLIPVLVNSKHIIKQDTKRINKDSQCFTLPNHI